MMHVDEEEQMDMEARVCSPSFRVFLSFAPLCFPLSVPSSLAFLESLASR